LTWGGVALVAIFVGTLLYAIVNHIDRFLVTKERKESSTESVMIFSSLVAGSIMFPVMLVYANFAISFNLQPALLAVLAAISYILANYFYFRSLEKDDTTVVVAMFQLIPIFTFTISAVFFHELLTVQQIVGGVIIIASTITITTNLEDLRGRQNYRVLGLMALSSLLYAIFFKLFEISSKTGDYGSTSVFFHVGLALIGLFLWSRQKYRQEFIKSIKQNGRIFVGLNALNEVLNAVATQLLNYAVLFIPLAIVNTLNGFQPAFVLILGLIGMRFYPKVFYDELSRAELVKKIVCISVSLVGLYIMFS